MNRKIGFNFRRVSQRGSSLTVVIPKALAKDLKIEDGDMMQIDKFQRSLVMRKIYKNKIFNE